jgi:hypothetical protein
MKGGVAEKSAIDRNAFLSIIKGIISPDNS